MVVNTAVELQQCGRGGMLIKPPIQKPNEFSGLIATSINMKRPGHIGSKSNSKILIALYSVKDYTIQD